MTGPKSTGNKAQQGQQGDQHVVQSHDQQIDLAISQIGDDQEPLLDYLKTLSLAERTALQRRYTLRPPHPGPVVRLTIQLIAQLAPKQQLPQTMRTGPDPGDNSHSDDRSGPGAPPAMALHA
jgi:hypothetical protein